MRFSERAQIICAVPEESVSGPLISDQFQDTTDRIVRSISKKTLSLIPVNLTEVRLSKILYSNNGSELIFRRDDRKLIPSPFSKKAKPWKSPASPSSSSSPSRSWA